MIDNLAELYADFMQFYGVRIMDVLKFDGTLTPPEALALFEQLPFESRMSAERQGGVEYRGWTLQQYVDVAILEQLQLGNYLFTAANSKKKPKVPKPIARPGDAERKKQENKNNPFSRMVEGTMNKL